MKWSCHIWLTDINRQSWCFNWRPIFLNVQASVKKEMLTNPFDMAHSGQEMTFTVLEQSDLYRIFYTDIWAGSWDYGNFHPLSTHSSNAHAQPSIGKDVWFLVGPFIFFHTSCVRTAKALMRLPECADSSEPSLVGYVISTIISWAGSLFLQVPLTSQAQELGTVKKW